MGVAQEFAEVCRRGLHCIRPLDAARARSRDEAGWNYGAGYPPSYQGYGRLRALLTTKLARSLSPSRALEIAAGDGALAATLACEDVEAHANDLRDDLLRESLATFRCGQLVRVHAGDAFGLSARAIGRFDLVLACEVIEHVAHPDRLLAHLATLLAPGGRILLTTPNGLHFRNRLPTFEQVADPVALEGRQFQPDADGHLFLLTPPELHRLAERGGLEVERIELLASPVITGHAGLRYLAGRVPVGWLWEIERKLMASPVRERLAYSMFALLRARPGSR